MSTLSNAPAVIRALVLALGALLAEVDRLSPAAFPDRAAARSFKARLRETQRLYSAVLGVQRGAPAPVASPEVLAVLRELVEVTAGVFPPASPSDRRVRRAQRLLRRTMAPTA